MISYLDNLSGKVVTVKNTVKQIHALSYDEEVLCAGWNPAINELNTCLLTVAEAEHERLAGKSK